MLKALLLIAVVAAVAWLLTGRLNRQYHEFAEHAVRVPGTILGKDERTIDPKNRRREYWVRFSYVDAAGTRHEAEEKVEQFELWLELKPGATADVLYAPERPSQAHLALLMEARMKVGDALTGSGASKPPSPEP